MNGLLNYLGDSLWCKTPSVIRDGLNATNPRKPFSLWKDIDGDFKELIEGFTNLDPPKRLAAHRLSRTRVADVAIDELPYLYKLPIVISLSRLCMVSRVNLPADSLTSIGLRIGCLRLENGRKQTLVVCSSP